MGKYLAVTAGFSINNNMNQSHNMIATDYQRHTLRRRKPITKQL